MESKKRKEPTETKDEPPSKRLNTSSFCDNYIVNRNQILLESMPYDQDREDRLTRGFEELVAAEVAKMDVDTQYEYQKKLTIESQLGLKIRTYDIADVRNLSWTGEYTHGASFGRTFVFTRHASIEPVTDLHFKTQAEFDAYWDKIREKGCVVWRFDSMDEANSACYDLLFKGGELFDLFFEVRRVTDLAARYKCTC